VGFFVCQYYQGAQQRDINEETDLNKYTYQYELPISILGDECSLELLYKANFNEFNISIINQSMYFDDAAGSYMIDIVIYGSDFIYPIVAGNYPTADDIEAGEPCAVLGKRMKQYTFKRDGEDYIRICGDEYRVTGYISADDSVIFDYRTILYYGCLGEGVSQDLTYFKQMPGWVFMAQSNFTDKSSMLRALIGAVESGNYDVLELGQYNHFTASRKVSRAYRDVAIVIYMFSIALVVLVVEYRLICRKKEFAIRKAYGYSSLSLLTGVIFELMVSAIIAVAISEVLMVFVNIIEKEAVIFEIRGLMGRIYVITRYLAITLPILIIRPSIRLIRENPIQLLIKKDY
jgi:hypothetical protein